MRRWMAARGIHTDTATRTHVLAFLEAYRAHAGQASLVRRFASIRFYYAWLVSRGSRADDPTAGIHLKQPIETPKQPFSLDELRRLFAVCRRWQERAILLLLVDTGLRLGEIVGLRRQDIDFGQGLVRVLGKGGKVRVVAPSARTLDALYLCLEDAAGTPRDYPWYSQRLHGPMTSDGFYRLIRRLGQRAGIAHVFPHRLRTTWACMFMEATGDAAAAQVILGHRRLETTMHYASWVRERRALDVMRRFSLSDRVAG